MDFGTWLVDMEALCQTESGGGSALCSIMELLVVEIVLAAERSLLLLLLEVWMLSLFIVLPAFVLC